MKLIPMAAAVMAAALTLANVALANPLPNPPPPGGPASSTIFDAMLAIARATTTNPAAAQQATFSYQAAIQQNNIGDFDRARMSALSAIGQTMPVPLPAPSVMAPSIPQPFYYQMPLLHGATQADAESFVALARRATMTCGAPGTLPAGIQQQNDAADTALNAHKYDTARAAAQSVIDQCAAATTAYATQQAALPQPSPTPIPLSAYSPVPVATLGPDPALRQSVR
jgi:hypothetical protein